MDVRRWRSSQNQSPLSTLERPQIVGHVWILRCERFDITDFDVQFFYAGPFCARAKEPMRMRWSRMGASGVTMK